MKMDFRIGMAIFLLLSVCIVTLRNVTEGSREVKRWEQNVWKQRNKAFALKSHLGASWDKPVRQTINWWNADFANLGFGVQIFRMYKNVKKHQDTYTIIHLRKAPRSWDGLCATKGVQAKFSPDIVGERLVGGTIYICPNALDSKKTPKRLRLLLHETTHIFWRGHPKYFGGRSAPNSTQKTLSHGEKEVLKSWVLPQLN